MLIKLDKSLINNLENEKDWPDKIMVVLENLATARREGKHIIISDPSTLKSISKCPKLSSSAKGVYQKLHNDYPQSKAYLSHVSKYIEIIDPCLVPKIISNGEQKVIQLPYTWFQDTKMIQETMFLCENLKDTEFYDTLAKVYCKWKNINIQIACEKRGGGGNTIADEYNNIQKSVKRFCLCVVDSDRLSPNSPLGSTAKTIKKIDDSKCVITELHILNVREIENLIPLKILSELLSNNQQRQQALRILEKIENSPINEIRKFLDIKKGTCFKDIIKSTELESFWKPKLEQFPSQNISNPIDPWCYDNLFCGEDSRCNCRISLGFGDNILDNTIDYLREKSPANITQLVDQSSSSDWKEIGQILINWFICDSPIRA